MNKDEALKMAIETLENVNSLLPCVGVIMDADWIGNKAIQACKEALAQSAHEPVAWLYKRENSSGGWYVVTNYEKENDSGTRNIECYDIPLYTHPAPSWQGLSDYEIDSIAHKNFTWEFSSKELEQFAHAIEAALKEKNAI